jgi:hypothetical protein
MHDNDFYADNMRSLQLQVSSLVAIRESDLTEATHDDFKFVIHVTASTQAF